MNELNIVEYAPLTGKTIQRFNTVCTLVAACIGTVVQDQVGWTKMKQTSCRRQNCCFYHIVQHVF